MADIRRLPRPISDIWDWQARGACRGLNIDLFFHPDRQRGAVREAREARAKSVCRRCPVMDQCRRHALMVQEPYGVWGGLSESDRAELIRPRRDRAAKRVDVIGRDLTGAGREPHGPPPGPRPA